ncbi:hypothetical protein JCM9533A_13700 [Catenuloplanes niger JCM 9533]
MPAAGRRAPERRSRRLTCAACGHTRTWSPRTGSSWWGAAVDPFFQRPLWLTAPVRGHLLWAYNRHHLTLPAEYAAAGPRKRGPYGGSMIETLPAWLKSAANRAHVRSATSRLMARLADPGRPTTRPRRPERPAGLRRLGA